MNKIQYFPKFYDRSEVRARQNELVALRKELIDSSKLTESEIDTIRDFDITLCADTYSRNYIIRELNELVDFVKCR